MPISEYRSNIRFGSTPPPNAADRRDTCPRANVRADSRRGSGAHPSPRGLHKAMGATPMDHSLKKQSRCSQTQVRGRESSSGVGSARPKRMGPSCAAASTCASRPSCNAQGRQAHSTSTDKRALNKAPWNLNRAHFTCGAERLIELYAINAEKYEMGN